MPRKNFTAIEKVVLITIFATLDGLRPQTQNRFALRATSGSPLDRDQAKPWTPRKSCGFSVILKTLWR